LFSKTCIVIAIFTISSTIFEIENIKQGDIFVINDGNKIKFKPISQNRQALSLLGKGLI